MAGLELAAHVTTKKNHRWNKQRWQLGSGFAELRGDAPSLPLVQQAALDRNVDLDHLQHARTQFVTTLHAVELTIAFIDGLFDLWP